MDDEKLAGKFQDLHSRFAKNSDERLKIENERNDINAQKAVAVKKKWLHQLGKSQHSRSFHGDDERLAADSIQETIDLCHQHLRGLDEDLNRLEAARNTLLKELDQLKHQAPEHLTKYGDDANTCDQLPSHVSHRRTGRRLKSRSESPTKIGQRYELQRKIDEELRKLQLADGMAHVEENHRNVSDHEAGSSEFENCNSENKPPRQPVINDCKLGADVEYSFKQNEESTREDPLAERDEINTLTDSEHSTVETTLLRNCVDSSDCTEEPSTEQQPDMEQSMQSQEMQSDNAARCSMTSLGGTTDTFALSSKSTGTEGDATKETISIDQPPPRESDDSLNNLDSSKMASDETESTEKIRSEEEEEMELFDPARETKRTKFLVENQVLSENHDLQTVSDDDVKSSQESGLDAQRGDLEDDKDLRKTAETLIHVLTAGESELLEANKPISDDVEERENGVTEKNRTLDNVQTVWQDVHEEDDQLEVITAERLDDGLEMEPQNIPDSTASMKNTVLEQHIAETASLTIEQVVRNTDKKTAKQAVEENTETIAEQSTGTVSEETQNGTDTRTGDNASSEQDVTDTDGKCSTDDEYSGYDIDMGVQSLCHEETDITGEDTILEDWSKTEEYRTRKACDSEDIPLFADVRYTVGEQINFENQPSVGLEDDDRSPTEEKESPEYSDVIPWGSDVLLGLDSSTGFTSFQNMSFPSDKADTGSHDSRSSLNESLDIFDRETENKIARETVAYAIMAAYDIFVQASANKDNKSEDQNTPDLSSECDNDSLHCAENTTLDKAVNGNSDKNHTYGETYRTKVENFTESTAEVRENNVTLQENTRAEVFVATEIAAIETAERAPAAHVQKAASEFLAEGEVLEIFLNHSQSVVVPQDGVKGADGDAVADIAHSGIITEIQGKNTKKSQAVEVEIKCTEIVQTSSETSEGAENDMETVQNSSENIRNFPERITYNPALSRRNTEAAKWFGQSTSENKIWLTPLGKVDDNAELERKKLIKAMTRRNNPNVAPKWQPPKEKNIMENLDKKQKESLKKYEERRRSRADAGSSEDSEYVTASVQIVHDPTVPKDTKSSQLPRENIVTESVVHSRDAIGLWENRLSEKQHKEKLEKQRLSVGKQKKFRDHLSLEVNGRTRSDSASSVNSNASGMLLLPTSEHIERGSMNVSKVRNRWKNIEEESSKAKPNSTVKEEKPSRRLNFKVKTAPMFRSFQSSVSAATRPVNAGPVIVNRGGPAVIRPLQEKESFIDREIREAAEREERWKHEQWEKMSEISAASSEDVFPDIVLAPPSGKNAMSAVHAHHVTAEDLAGLEIMKDADREESWKLEHETRKIDSSSIRHRSKESSGIGSDIVSPPPGRLLNSHQQQVDWESASSHGSYHASLSPPVAVNDSPKTVNLDVKKYDSLQNCKQSTRPSVGTSSSSVDAVRHEIVSEIPAQTEDEDFRARRLRIASLSNAVTPKGWEPNKGRAVGPVSPVSPVHRSVPKPEVKYQQSSKLERVSEPQNILLASSTISSPPSPPAPAAVTHEGEVKSFEEEDVAERQTYLQQKTLEPELYTDVHISPSVSISPTRSGGGARNGGPVLQKKSGGLIEVSSNKNRLQSIMEKEMQDAAAREEEWRKKQLELMDQGLDMSRHPVVHSTREIRTPTCATPPPAVNSGEQQQVKLRRPVKSLFASDDDEEPHQIKDESSDKYKKRVVVKATRMPKRKSQLAMQWEDGQFQNNIHDENK